MDGSRQRGFGAVVSVKQLPASLHLKEKRGLYNGSFKTDMS